MRSIDVINKILTAESDISAVQENVDIRLDGKSFKYLTKDEYDAIIEKDPDIVYCITDEEEVTKEYVDNALKGKSDIHTHPYKSNDYVPNWNEITSKPTSFQPTNHRHNASEIDGLESGGSGTGELIPRITKNPIESEIFILSEEKCEYDMTTATPEKFEVNSNANTFKTIEGGGRMKFTITKSGTLSFTPVQTGEGYYLYRTSINGIYENTGWISHSKKTSFDFSTGDNVEVEFYATSSNWEFKFESGFKECVYFNSSVGMVELGGVGEGSGQVDLTGYATEDFVMDKLGGKKHVYLTQVEYDALTEEQKNDETIVYAITDAEDKDVADLKLTGSKLDLINKDGTVIGNGVTLPSGGSSDVTKAYVDSQDKLLDDKIDNLSVKVDNHLANHPSGEGGSILTNMKWCVIGDSISDVGVGRTNTFYQEFISNRVGCELVDWNGNGTGYVKEFNGTKGLIDRIDEIPSDSNIITIFLGTNDNIPLGKLGDATSETFYGAVEYCVKSIKEKFPLIPLGIITPLPSIYKDNKSYSKAITDICEKYYVPSLNLNKMCGFNLTSPLFRLNYIPDGLHPNDNGHRDLSYKIEHWLENEVLVCKFENNIIQRGIVEFKGDNITFNPGSTIDLEVGLSHVPNENQGVKITSSNNAIILDKTTLYFNKTNSYQIVRITIPSDINENFVIIGETWQIKSEVSFVIESSSETFPVTSVSVSPKNATLNIGETIQLSKTITPQQATNHDVVWESSNSNATVSTEGFVTAKSSGGCVITCRTVDGNKTDSCAIEILETEGGGEVDLTDYVFKGDFNDNSNFSLLKDLSGRENNLRLGGVSSWENGIMTITTPSGNAGLLPTNLKELIETPEVSIEIIFRNTREPYSSSTLLFLSNNRISSTYKEDGMTFTVKGISDSGSDVWIGGPASKFDISEFNHVVYTMSKNSIKAYVNGVLNASMNITTDFSHYLLSSVQAFCYLFTGELKCFNILKRELTEGEVARSHSKCNK